MGSRADWNVSMVEIHLRTLCGCTTLSMPVWREMTEQTQWREKQPSQVACCKELETLPAGTKPGTSHHRSPGAERRGKRKRYTIFLERTREGHHQSDEHFKGEVGETSERRGGAHMGFSKRTNTILSWNELVWMSFGSFRCFVVFSTYISIGATCC